MISESYTKFFEKLEKNNSKEWFDEHRKQYEKDVRDPFIQFIDELIPFLREWDTRIIADPKKALFRINRDIRFSKDKTPYNTSMKAKLSPGGKKSELPGFFIGISSSTLHIGGGIYGLSTTNVKQMRKHIYANQQEFKSLLKHTAFKTKFGNLKGEKAKRLSAPFSEIQETLPEIANKQFYVMANLELKPLLRGSALIDTTKNYCNSVFPLNQFLSKADFD